MQSLTQCMVGLHFRSFKVLLALSLHCLPNGGLKFDTRGYLKVRGTGDKTGDTVFSEGDEVLDGSLSTRLRTLMRVERDARDEGGCVRPTQWGQRSLTK